VNIGNEKDGAALHLRRQILVIKLMSSHFVLPCFLQDPAGIQHRKKKRSQQPFFHDGTPLFLYKI
jgi:hypothetical protein